MIRLACLIAVSIALTVDSYAEAPWIIDPHTHFKGEQQIAYERQLQQRDPRDTLGQVVVAEDYRELADRLKIQSTMVVEATDQSQPQFNDWVLKQAASDLICGYVARADLHLAEFKQQHARYLASGFLKGYRFRFDELHGYLDDPRAREHLTILQSERMVVDLLVEPQHAADVVRLATEFPKLTIVINHCFRARMKDGKTTAAWRKAVADCGKHANVYCKLSSILNFAETKPFDERAPSDLETYREILDTCWQAFGKDRVIFATNWGVCGHFGPVEDVVRIVSEFLKEKGETALRSGMRENALRVYQVKAKHLR